GASPNFVLPQKVLSDSNDKKPINPHHKAITNVSKTDQPHIKRSVPYIPLMQDIWHTVLSGTTVRQC
ncbi:hypothetical protein, partial [Paramuribaculum intestinale]